MKMKQKITQRLTGEVLFEVEIDCAENASRGTSRRFDLPKERPDARACTELACVGRGRFGGHEASCGNGGRVMPLTTHFYNCWFDPPREPTAKELKNYDALEIHPVQDVSDGPPEVVTYERCDPGDADIWTVYLHSKGGGIEALADCPTRDRAMTVVKILSQKWNKEITVQ